MTGLKQSLLGVLAFRESGVIHHDNGLRGELGNEVVDSPSREDIPLNVSVKQGNREQLILMDCADHMSAALRLPVLLAIAALTAQ